MKLSPRYEQHFLSLYLLRARLDAETVLEIHCRDSRDRSLRDHNRTHSSQGSSNIVHGDTNFHLVPAKSGIRLGFEQYHGDKMSR